MGGKDTNMSDEKELDIPQPSMNEVLDENFKHNMLGLNTCMPAQVQSYNASKNTCEVKPVFKKQYDNGDIVELLIS